VAKLRRQTRVWRGKATRETDWSYASGSSIINSGPTFALHYALIDENDLDQRYDGHCTVLRVVGDCWIYSVTSSTPGPTIGLGSLGLIVSDVDSVGGITPYAIFDPADAEASWLYYRSQMVGNVKAPGTSSALDEGNSGMLPDGSHIDVKVKRKMRDREALLLTFQIDNLTGFADVANARIAFSVRTLVKTT